MRFDREADLERSAATLASHTERTVLGMARELKAPPATVASMLANMAEAHRRAAARLDRLALAKKLERP